MKYGFDNDKYLKIQSEHIRQRISQFGDKLYLEFGGKLFDDNHASRVLPGFRPDSKMRMLRQLADSTEIIIVISALDIERNKVRNDLGITYDVDVLRLHDEFERHGFLVSAVVIGVLYWFFGTELGCAIRATGSNPAMSRAQGINTNFNIVLGLAVSNGLVALSGALLSQYQGFADVGMGRGAIVIGLAAVIIGEALFSRIFHNFALKMAAVSLGAIIYYIVIQLVLTLGFDANLLKLLSASVVAVFLAVPYWKSKYFAKPAAKKAQKEDAKNA